MTGSLSTLGLGSQGVLTNDLLDKLKAADKTGTIDPIERKQESLKMQQAGLVGLKDAISKLTTLATDLSDKALYTGTKSEVSGSSVTVESSPTAKSQTINLDVQNLATRDIQFSDKSYASKDTLFGEGDITLDIDGQSFTINVTDTDTLEDVAKKITDNSDGKIQASLLNIGGDEPFKLVIKSTDTGAKNAITINSSTSFTHPTGGEAKDAKLTVDGISVTRDSNEFDDLVDGVTIKLDSVGQSTIKIEQDFENVSTKMEEFVSQYNELVDSIKTLTNYDEEKKVAGVFQGTSEIKNLMTPLRNIFESTVSGNGKMSADFGISTDRDGRISFDKSKFEESLSSNSTEIQDFFVGEGATEGIFRKFNGELFNIGTKSDGVLKSLKTNYDSKSKTLEDSLTKAQARLDSKYEIMQKKFASYDAVIGKLSGQSDMLQGLIDGQSKD